jgi:ribosomal protein L5
LLKVREKKCMMVKVKIKMKKMTHFFSTAVKMKEVPQLRSTVTMSDDE